MDQPASPPSSGSSRPVSPSPRSGPTLPDLAGDPVALALALVDTPSVSGEETALADAVQAALAACPHLEVLRDGDTLVARTHLGRAERVVVAGHLDTVPVSRHTANVPGRLEEREGERVLWGRGSVDMKGGVAAILHLAATLTAPRRDVTWVLYDHEEVTGDLNGLGRTIARHPEWVTGDLAVLGEPTGAGIEGGCNGTLRLVLTVHGRAVHSGRAWRGVNAVHAAIPLLARAAAAPVREVEVEGLTYREGFSVVKVEAGVAANTVPDECVLTVNYRFAPDLTAAQALARALAVLDGVAEAALPGPDTVVGEVDPSTPLRLAAEAGLGAVDVVVDDLSPAARPGLDSPLARELVEAVTARGGAVGPKYGWTDVARFSAAGVPAVNLGPGDPMLCHTDDEHCPTAQVTAVVDVLRSWLG